jgi:competence protein ComEC
VTFLDVGQGDATLVELPGGAAWLIDAGGLPVRADALRGGADAARVQRAPGEAILRTLRHRRIARLQRVLVTHPHPDHYLGLGALVGRVPIDEVWIARPPDGAQPPRDLELPTLDALLDQLRARGTRVTHPPLGAAALPGGVTVEVLAPRAVDAAGVPLPVAAADPVRSLNDDSLVVALRRAGRTILLPGDVEQEGEDLLLGHGASLAADVVKVPHHGSATSSTPGFVAAVGAAWAVVSCGRGNRFGFPAAAVVERWRASGAAVLQTAVEGSIVVEVEPDGRLAVGPAW